MTYERGGVLWSAVLLLAVLTNHVALSASHGESCSQTSDCVGSNFICSNNNLCACAENYTYMAIAQECKANEITVIPDYFFTTESVFPTDMTYDDLDAARLDEMKTVLETQLTRLFENVTGFNGAYVRFIQINETDRILVAGWTVTINRQDPSFSGKTPDEILSIIRPELERASLMYNSIVRLDTKKREKKTNTLALGLGVGLGVLFAVLLISVLVGVAVCRGRDKGCIRRGGGGMKKTKSISDASSSAVSGGSSKMDPEEYKYDGTFNGGFKVLPPIYESIYDTLSLPSVGDSQSCLYAQINDTISLKK